VKPIFYIKKVIIESPYKGDIETNETYARLAMCDSIMRGEAPFASHLLYTQVLDDNEPNERELGLNLGISWIKAADLVAFYVDLGMSPGMTQTWKMLKARRIRVPFETREIGRELVRNVLHQV
jgi:hypothetical protein